MKNMLCFTENQRELGNLLIESFQNLSEKDRFILSNNTFMVASQMKQTFGEAIDEKVKTFTHEDWRGAWNIFNGHYDEEGEFEDDEI